MSPRKSIFPIHPFFFAIYPIVSLYGYNFDEVRFSEILRSMGVSLLVTIFLTCLFRIASKTWKNAALSSSLVILLFFSYGHVYFVLRDPLKGSILGQANVLMAIWAAILILGVWAFIRLLRNPDNLTTLANVVSAAALIISLYQIGTSLTNNQKAGKTTFKHPIDLTPEPGQAWTGEKPDIFYIILDGYGRSDVLQEFYNVDNSAFLDWLQKRGFTVTGASHTNYWKTPLSMASSLNFHYIDDLLELQPQSTDQRPLEELIKHSASRRFLESIGYQTIAFSTGYNFSEIDDAGVYYGSVSPFTPFELNLLSRSMAIYWLDWEIPIAHRLDILQHVSQLSKVPEISGPKLVIAHLVIPHPPFVFDESGNLPANINSKGGNAFIGDTGDYLHLYSGQVKYLNKILEKTIGDILANSERPPVIILQGDHGPDAFLNWLSVDGSCLQERFPIFNAYYFPGKELAQQSIPDDVAPVNSFRLVLNAYFDTRLPIEPSRYYAAHWARPYELYDVTDRLEWCPANLITAKP